MWYDTIVADNSPQAKFSTIVEYCGGKEPSPTYRRIKDYTEAIWIEYNPDLISFDTLIQHWLEQHSPTYPTTNTQYKSALWYGNDEEKESCLGAVQSMQDKLGQTVYSGTYYEYISLYSLLSFYKKKRIC